MLKALKNHILFKFVDPVNSKGEFVRAKTSFGLEFISTADDSAKAPRWGEVIAVGPDVKEVQAGDMILLPALRWTIGTKYEGERFWRTDETQVVVCKRGTGFAVLNNFVVFKRDPVKRRQSAVLLVTDVDNNTSTGTVQKVSKKVEECDTVCPDCKIYFDGNGFNHTTLPEDTVAPFQFSFIKEDDILLYEPVEPVVAVN